jgi:LuxR family maltose regulon positive regulatory protein
MPLRTPPALVQSGRFDSPFFRSKFRVPAAPQHFMHRARLTELLDDLAEYPVTAVVAPAGAGKTALAADWVRRGRWQSAWLAIDQSDRDPVQFCAAIISALEPLAPGVVDRTLGALSDPAGPLGAVRLLSDDLELATCGSAVLVMDDLHRIDDSELARSALGAFVEHKPAWLHLLLLSRRRLALPVDRLRASGSLVDITFDNLKFSQQEDLEMLSGLCPGSAPQELTSAAEWSGGWAAALQLAALAVRSRRPARLTEDGAAIAGQAGSGLVDSYLWHEVMRAERPELVDLLVSTAVVDRMNYGLAEALSGRSDAGDLLQEAEERGLFVTGFDSGGWFEVHSLVREVLLSELERRSSERLLEQHARAARWLESMADHMAAIEHWLDAGEPGEALRLLAAISMSRLDTGSDPEAVFRILERIPPEVSGADAASLVQYAWCHLRIDRTAFLDAVSAVEGALTEGGTTQDEGRLHLLRSASAWLAGEWRACIDQARAGVELLGDTAPFDPIGRFGWSLMAHGVALEERWSDGCAVVGAGRAAVVIDTEGRWRTKGRARWVSRSPDNPSTRCASPGESAGWRSRQRCEHSGPSSTSPTRSLPASSVTGRKPRPPCSTWPVGRRTPAPTSRCSQRSSWSRCVWTSVRSRPPGPCSTRLRSWRGAIWPVLEAWAGSPGRECWSRWPRTTWPPQSTGRLRSTTSSGAGSARQGSTSPRDDRRTPPRRSTARSRAASDTWSCDTCCSRGPSPTATAGPPSSTWRPPSIAPRSTACSRRSRRKAGR